MSKVLIVDRNDTTWVYDGGLKTWEILEDSPSSYVPVVSLDKKFFGKVVNRHIVAVIEPLGENDD